MMLFKFVIKTILKLLGILIPVALLLIVYGVYIEPSSLKVTEKTLYLPYFYSEHNGLKVAVLSDFHLGGPGCDINKLKKIVKVTNAQYPDLIFLLGDVDSVLINKNNCDKDEIAQIFSQFTAKYGVVSVLGNHDIYPGDIKPIIKNAGIKLLENQKTVKYINNKPLVIYGIKDYWHFHPNVKKIIKPFNKNGSMILLSHNPDVFPDVPEFVSLTLSGHNHGGQICLPFLGGIFTPSKWEQRYNKGYIAENNKHIYVTCGLGNSVPFRLGVPPEIVILTLYSQDDYPADKIENTPPLKGLRHSLNKIGIEYYNKLFVKNK